MATVTARQRILPSIVGGLAGSLIGLVGAFVAALLLYWAGIDFTAEERGPLDFEDAYAAWLAAVWIPPLIGLGAGTVYGWRRAGRPGTVRKPIAVAVIVVGAALSAYSMPFVTALAFTMFVLGAAIVVGGLRMYRSTSVS